ncbi:MAG: helix-turn-helix domain-containing protein [Candidatus Zophobacter franzmannii]|jgi:transposase-like protein|nr:helix-turn-helix domain-containing protein [Candidatus Zophobacter franzmannii]
MSDEKEKRIQRNYSVVFKMKVVDEIENGYLTQGEAQRLYHISSISTIQGWIKKYGMNARIERTVLIMGKDEKSELISLRKENRRLQRALDDSYLKELALETLIEVSGNQMGIDLKKKLGSLVQEKLKKELLSVDSDTED